MTEALSGRAAEAAEFSDPVVAHPPVSAGYADALGGVAREIGSLDLFDRLAAIRAAIAGRIVFTTSFGLEDQAIAHAIFSQQLAIEVATLDTGRLFPETHQVWAATEKRYRVGVRALVPDAASLEALIASQGIDGFRASVAARHACCNVRKVVPLGRVLEDASGWVTGLRARQSRTREQLACVSFDAARRLAKISPLFDWTRDQVAHFVRAHGVPVNPLHERGFLSIGCAPCTRAVRPGEPERAGRWWWERNETRECGLHVAPAGGTVRAAGVTG
jgi:phosphoadenosine phosphosulfate reductase